MSAPPVIVAVLVSLVVLAVLAACACWLIQDARRGRRRRYIQDQTRLAEQQLRRLRRQAISQLLDEATRSLTESQRAPRP